MRKTADEHRQALIVDLAASRESLLAAICALPADSRDAACIGTWTVKDLIAHLIGWDFTNLQAVKEILSGERPSFFQHYDADWRTYNAQLVEKYRKESFEALLEEAASSQKQLIAFLQALQPAAILKGKSPADQGRVITIHGLLRAEAQDECKHRDQVLAYLTKYSPETYR